MRGAYYNENEPYAAAWLRNLISAGLIAPGDVDERSIVDVRPADVADYRQCHFFAGIGGWSLALRLASWPDDRPVWTGSCPCQPFSSAGARKGFADERHLWPVWFDLIRECRPSAIFGEQVSRAIGQGWLDAVSDDLEGEGYAIGSAVLPACAVDAPHRRDRLWFVADAYKLSQRNGQLQRRGEQHRACGDQETGNCGDAADADNARLGKLIDGHAGQRAPAIGSGRPWPPESGIRRVAHGIPARAPKLRALGNAIVPQVAAAFIAAYLDVARP